MSATTGNRDGYLITAAKLVQIGTLTLDVIMRNPSQAAPDSHFTYVDLGAVDQARKKITGANQLLGRDAPSRARQVIHADDVVLSTVRPNLNGVALVSAQYDGAIASTGFCVLRPKPDELASSFLFHWVRSNTFIEKMIRLATGASYPAVTDAIVRRSLIPVPSLAEQHRIAAILDQADVLRAKRQGTLARLDELAHAIFLETFGDPVTNPKGWDESAALGDVAEIGSGITKGRKLPAGTLQTLPYLAVSNVQDRRLDLSVVKAIDVSPDEAARYALQRGDLLLTEGGDPDKLGRGALWSEEVAHCIHQNHVFRVRVSDARVHPRFLLWLVGSERGKRYFLRAAKQTTGIATINMSQLRAFPLLLPPTSVQHDFAERLDAIEQLRTTAAKARAEADALFASLQHRAFRGEL